jgi:hypothetical protein
MLIDRVGMDKVNATGAPLGVPEVKLQWKMIRPRDSAAGNENIATPAAADDHGEDREVRASDVEGAMWRAAPAARS